MSDAESGARASRWVLVTLVIVSLLVAAGVIGVPFVIRGDLIANQARTCNIAEAFVRERPGATSEGPDEVGACLADVLRDLDPALRQRLEDAMVHHDSRFREPSQPLDGTLLDIPLGDGTFAAVARCAGARTSRWRGGHGLAMRGLLERFSREAHLERDPDRRLRRLLVALELWIDAYAMLDLSIVEPVLWAREIGQGGSGASPETTEMVAERMRALAASLPDIETTTALFYCSVYGEVRELELFDAWQANEEFGASLAMAAETEPATWGREPSPRRLDRAIPSGALYDQLAEPGSAYVAAMLIVAARQLDPKDERFLGQSVSVLPAAEQPLSRNPCSRLVLPSALESREIQICAIDPSAVVASRELTRLYRALRTRALRGEPIPERVDDRSLPSESSATSPASSELGSRSEPSASESQPATVLSQPGCTEEPRPPTALEAWRAVGYEAPASRRVTLTLLHPDTPPAASALEPPSSDPGWRLLRARWRIGRVPNLLDPSTVICDGPVREARLWVGGPPDYHARQIELSELSEPGAQSP